MHLLTIEHMNEVSGGAQGYWMENYSGEYKWIPTNSREYGIMAGPYMQYIARTEEGIRALDRDGGDLSGGGCYKWE